MKNTNNKETTGLVGWWESCSQPNPNTRTFSRRHPTPYSSLNSDLGGVEIVMDFHNDNIADLSIIGKLPDKTFIKISKFNIQGIENALKEANKLVSVWEHAYKMSL